MLRSLPPRRFNGSVRECDTLVFNAFSGFHPDAFWCLGGDIEGWGLLLLLTPPREVWPTYPP